MINYYTLNHGHKISLSAAPLLPIRARYDHAVWLKPLHQELAVLARKNGDLLKFNHAALIQKDPGVAFMLHQGLPPG